MEDYEKLGAFYLGREYDLNARAVRPELLLYDARDLTTHAVCVGMTGSGKTGLCLALLEEAAIDGVPVIAIDPKGDLGNLLLTFPRLAPEDFRPWIDEAEAARQGISPDELAAQTAQRWREGLAEWGQGPERIERFRSAADVAIYTPGSSAGLPLTVLRSFSAPPPEILADGDALRERIGSAVSALLALIGVDADPIRSREHILLSQLLDRAWQQGQDLDLASLIRGIREPDFDRVGFLDLETFFPAKDRLDLAMRLNNLLASPGFAGWMEGEPLDVGRLLHTSEGRPRIAILSISHLSDAERMFFVTILLNEVLAWVRAQSGTSSLRAILYMDEVFGYFPPTANPPSKQPMLTLLKQARAFGLGVVLATQNPVDLDYKGLSNAGTWFLGRLQTERDKARVLEGLEGAAAAAGAKMDRGQMEAALSALGNRVFLMNNVHDDHPVVFQSRWCLCYLRGPLTRGQIQTLMAPRKEASERKIEDVAIHTVEHVSRTNVQEPAAMQRPLLPPGIDELFLSRPKPPGEPAPRVYHPALFGMARLHYVEAKTGTDYWQSLGLLSPADDDPGSDPWASADVYDTPGERDISQTPVANLGFAPLPSSLAQPKNYAAWSKALARHLQQHQKLTLWQAPSLKEVSRPGETEAEFRIRLQQRSREQRDEAIDKLRKRYAAKIDSLTGQIRRAEERVAREKSQFQSQTVQTVVSLGSSILRALVGRKLASSANVTGAASTARSASRAAREREDIGRAEAALADLQSKLTELETQVQTEVDELESRYRDFAIEEYSVSPRKSEISVEKVALAWLAEP